MYLLARSSVYDVLTINKICSTNITKLAPGVNDLCTKKVLARCFCCQCSLGDVVRVHHERMSERTRVGPCEPCLIRCWQRHCGNTKRDTTTTQVVCLFSCAHNVMVENCNW